MRGRIRVGLGVFVLAMSLAAPAAGGQFEDGEAAFDRGDYETALRDLRPLADQGDGIAQEVVGFIYASGHGVPKDDIEAVKWYRKAAEQGLTLAEVKLGMMYLGGTGTPQDDAEAARWLRKAADQGDADAQYFVGRLYRIGAGVVQNYAEAFKWHRKAADQGVALAQVDLGMMYLSGTGTPKDDAEAARWFRKAADQGDVSAQTNLGTMYYNGQGVHKDYTEAARWFRKAADQGDAAAQLKLYVATANGLGVQKDDAEALEWLLKAADQGYAIAQSQIGIMYREGRGVPQDYVQAYKWFDLAAASIPASDAEGRDDAIAMRDRSAANMSPAQIAQAQRLAAQWSANSTNRFAAKSPTPPKETEESTGTGYVVDDKGLVVTNRHVIAGCMRLAVRRGEQAVIAELVVSDESNDLAVVRGILPGLLPVRFRDGKGIRTADAVVVMGYPYAGILANSPQVTTGTITALAGIGDDSRFLQISAPIQPGNSGGPVFDLSGNVVGTVVSTLDPLVVAKASGSLPQNVNFAIKAGIVRQFLESKGIAYLTANSATKMDPADVSEATAKSVVIVECTR
ncbi:MAG: trypsin-like peptidase domain-containing protein [Roseiarcus sp.]